jgi:hypothetical protein
MRILLIIMLILPGYSFAQRNLSKDAFMAKVRPVLNGILGDFYQMITHFPDFPKELIPIVHELDSLTADKEILRVACPRVISTPCKDTVNSIRGKLVRLRQLSLTLQISQKMSGSLYLNSMSGLRLVTEFDYELEEVKALLDNASFIMTAEVPQKKETYRVIKELDELNTLLSLALVEFIPFTYREDFRHFYFNFIHPIQIQISKHNNFEFLNKNVNSLNFAVNLLNMNLTKRNKKTPDGMASFLAVIHNRWNSLLRYYF